MHIAYIDTTVWQQPGIIYHFLAARVPEGCTDTVVVQNYHHFPFRSH